MCVLQEIALSADISITNDFLAAYSRVSSIFYFNTFLISFATASITFTVTLFPNCLYKCVSAKGSSKLSGKPWSRAHSRGVILRTPSLLILPYICVVGVRFFWRLSITRFLSRPIPPHTIAPATSLQSRISYPNPLPFDS